MPFHILKNTICSKDGISDKVRGKFWCALLEEEGQSKGFKEQMFLKLVMFKNDDIESKMFKELIRERSALPCMEKDDQG